MCKPYLSSSIFDLKKLGVESEIFFKFGFVYCEEAFGSFFAPNMRQMGNIKKGFMEIQARN